MSGQDRTFVNQCKANGCTLTASHITDYWPREKNGKAAPRWGVCEYHRLGESKQWSDITQRINKQKTIITLIDGIQQIKDKRFLPYSNEKVNDWLARIRKDLHNELLNRSINKTNIDSIDQFKLILMAKKERAS